MNIAQEIYESIQELYQEIIKVDLKTGKSDNPPQHHGSFRPRKKNVIWDSQLEKYMKNKIQPSDHERMRDNFCLRHLRNECEKGKGLFSNNFSTMNGKLPDNHVTVLAFAPGNDSQEKGLYPASQGRTGILYVVHRESVCIIDLRLFYLSGREA